MSRTSYEAKPSPPTTKADPHPHVDVVELALEPIDEVAHAQPVEVRRGGQGDGVHRERARRVDDLLDGRVGAEDRVATASRLVDRLAGEGVPLEDIYVDPCVFPVSTGPEHGAGVKDAIRIIKERYPGVHISGGVSNVSFGLPVRKLLNRTFLTILLAEGLDTAIIDPCDKELMATLLAAEALLGKDEYCMAYLAAHREGQLQ